MNSHYLSLKKPKRQQNLAINLFLYVCCKNVFYSLKIFLAILCIYITSRKIFGEKKESEIYSEKKNEACRLSILHASEYQDAM